MAMYVLYKSSSGYALFHVHGLAEIGQNTEAVRNSASDFSRFGQVVKLTAFHPSKTALKALNQIKTVSKGYMSEELRSFLDLNLPKVKEGEEPKFALGVSNPKLASYIFEATKIPCQSNEFVQELLKGVHQHFDRFIHIYSRSAKVKSIVTPEENMFIQSTYLFDTLEKDINKFAMTVRQLYSRHFPELDEIVKDNYMYAQLSKIIEDKSKLSEEDLPMLTEVLGDEDKAREVIEAGQASIGLDGPIPSQTFAQSVIDLIGYRKKMYDYLVDKVNIIAPNLAALIGEIVAARLISRAGGLRNLAMFPFSTLQILGADKALLRAWRTGGNTPKHGLIFKSSFIGRASSRNKGRIARCLASKCSFAARVDYFGDSRSADYGEKLREEVEERLDFLHNVYVMEEVEENDEVIIDASEEKIDEEEKQSI